MAKKDNTIVILAVAVVAVLLLKGKVRAILSETESKGYPKLESPLDQIVSAEKQGEATQLLRQYGLQASDGRLRVIVETIAGNEAKAADRVQALGGNIETSYQNLLQALMPVSSLESLADDVSVKLVRLPLEPIPDYYTVTTGRK